MRFRAARVARASLKINWPKINCGKSAELMAQIGFDKEPYGLGLRIDLAQGPSGAFGIESGIDRFGTRCGVGQPERADAPGRPFDRMRDVAPLFGVASLDHALELAHELRRLPHEQLENLRIQYGISARVASEMGHIDRTRLCRRHRQNPIEAAVILIRDRSRRR